MVISLLPTNVAFAAATSGTCGDNLTWSYNNGTLTISGSGDMEDYKSPSTAPWYSLKDSITDVVIKDGITKIGESSFYYYTKIKSVAIPESVASVGSSAFYDCHSISEVKISSISAWCNIDFAYSSNPLENYASLSIDGETITNLVIPNNVTHIKKYAFIRCRKIKTVEIPESVVSIADNAFRRCEDLVSFNVNEANKNYCSVDGVLFNHDKTTLLRYPSTGVEYTIPASVTSVGAYAFSKCTKLSALVIPDTVKSFDEYAFDNVYSIDKVTITDLSKWCNIDFASSESNPLDGAKKIYLNDAEITDLIIPDDVTEIKDYTFYNSKSLKSVKISDKVKQIGKYAFEDCTGTEEVFIGDGVVDIGYYAFYRCTALEKITFGKNIKTIAYGAFKNCSSLTDISLPNGVDKIGTGAFDECTNLVNITLPDSLTEIGSAFTNTGYYNNTQNWENDVLYIDKTLIEAKTTISGEYTIAAGTKCIADSAFSHCESLTSVTIPNSVVTIGDYAFNYCNKLSNISLGKGVKRIGANAFCCNITKIEIPESVESIGGAAFYSCYNLRFVYISNLSKWCNIDFESASANPLSRSDCALYLNGKEVTDLTIPNDVTSIGNYAFYGCSDLTSVVVDDNVESIGNGAFASSSLVSISIGKGVKHIGEAVFGQYTPKLTDISVNEQNEYYCSVGGNLFNKEKTELLKYSSKEETVYSIPEGVETVRENAFSRCANLAEIYMPDSVTAICDYAFYSCANLSKIKFSQCVKTIGEYAFWACNNLNNVELPESVDTIGREALTYCRNLESITIPDGIIALPNGVFRGCNKLTEVTLPNSIKSIAYSVFEQCSKLEQVYYNGTKEQFKKINISDSNNDSFFEAEKIYFAYVSFFDKNSNLLGKIKQALNTSIDESSLTILGGDFLKIYKNKEMTEEYSFYTPISENLTLYVDIIELNKLKITGAESVDIGQKEITESVTFATEKMAKDFVATIKYSDKLNFVKAKSEIFDIETDEYTDGGQKYLSLTCTYKNDENMPKNTTLNAFDLVFDVSESATANEKLTIEFVNDETFLADSGNNTYDFDGLGTAEIKVNPIFVKSITINGADEIDKATQYTAAISPENATNKDIEWTVDNSEIATISDDGTLTPVKAGTVKITATAKDGSGISGEKSVNVKVYATITSLSASAGEWDKTFTPSEREYTIYVPKDTSSIKLTATHNGTLLKGTTKYYSGKAKSISLTDTETVLTLTYSETDYTDSEYKIKIVKFEGTKTTVSNDGTKFTVTPINIANGSTVILALYDGDKFVEMQSKAYAGEDIPFTTDKSYTSAKVMVWDSLSSLKPVCDVEIVK